MSFMVGLKRFGLNIRAFGLAIVVHIALFALIGLNFDWSKTSNTGGGKPKVIEAVALHEKDIQNAVSALKEKQRIDDQKKLDAQKQLDLLEKKKQEETLRIKQLKKDRIEQEKKKAKAQQELQKEERRQKEAKQQRQIEERKSQAEKEKRDEAEKQRQLTERQAKERKRIEADKKRQAADAKRKQEELKKRQAKEKQKKAAAERKRQADAKRKKEKAAQKKRVAEAKKQASTKRKAEAERQKREAQFQQQLEQEAIGRAWQSALSQSKSAIQQAVNNNFGKQPGWAGLESKFLIDVTADGRVLNVRMIKSSGNVLFDGEAERAIRKSSPLPLLVRHSGARQEQIEFTFAPVF